ncbi:MAG: TOBE domain-containing protein [Eggerthellaceae bacterium]|nr:TOBE domain-containing protein [Eggerthellaceae bacterium]
MLVSARNQIPAVVENIQSGAVNGVVELRVSDDEFIKADITMESIKQLGLETGKKAYAIIKSSSVMVAPGTEKLNISARNQLRGKIAEIRRGAVNGHVYIDLDCGYRANAWITQDAIDNLNLAEGEPVMAVIKATEVMVGIDNE